MKNLKRHIIIDIPLLIILTLNGTKFNKDIRIRLNYISYLYAIIFHTFAIYTISVSAAHAIVQSDFKISLAYLSIIIQSYFLWYLFKFSQNKFFNTLECIQFHKNYLTITSNKNYKLYCLLLFIYCYPFTLSSLSTYLSYDSLDQAAFFSFGIKIRNMSLRNGLNFIGNIAYYTVYTQYPALITLSMCFLINYFKIILIEYKRQLKKLHLDVMFGHNIDILREYFNIVTSIRYLKDTLSFPLFLVIVNCFFNLYTTLAYFLQLTSPVEAAILLENTSNACMGCINLICLTLTSSRIPEELSELKVICGVLIQRHKLKYVHLEETIFLLKRIEKSETIYLTACGLVHFQRSFLLSAFGALLTYGLLVFNMK